MFIRKLTIERFRRIERLEWTPTRGLNCLVGPGDSGKTTLLNAIALLLDPRAPTQSSEYDYHQRKVEAGFHIEAVLGGVEEAVKGERVANLQGWKDGSITPIPEGDAESVLVVHVDGTKDLDIEHTLSTSSGDRVAFSSSLRRALLLARVSGGDRASTELRLGRGSLLERAVGAEGMRAQLADAFAKAAVALNVPEQTQKELGVLAESFARSGLPRDLGLSFLSPPGQSAIGMVGLTTGRGDASIPFAFSGQGTRQLALFTIASALMGDAPVIVIDEPEAGLEPYRQRAQVRELRRLAGTNGQVFMTTHSAATLSALEDREVWRLVGDASSPTSLDFPDASYFRRGEALLSRLPILCEGDTEFGFLPRLLSDVAQTSGIENIDALGLGFVRMHGQPSMFAPAKALLSRGIRIAVFADNEERHAGRRNELRTHALCAYGTWDGACDIEDAIARFMPWDKLAAIVELAAAETGRNVESIHQQIGEKAARKGKADLDQLKADIGEDATRRALAAAMGSEVLVADDDRRRGWFKTVESGRALGAKLLDLGLPPEIKRVIDVFWAEVQKQL